MSTAYKCDKCETTYDGWATNSANVAVLTQTGKVWSFDAHFRLNGSDCNICPTCLTHLVDTDFVIAVTNHD